MGIHSKILGLIGWASGIRPLMKDISVKLELGIITQIMVDSYIQENLHRGPKYQNPKKLNRYERQVYSQNGEDGIIEEIFNRIGATNHYFVEIGAGDGLQNNTAYLLAKGWKGHWIEANSTSFESLQRTYGFMMESKHLTAEQALVSAENVGPLLEKANVPEEFDILSIDVDGNDYWIWKAIESFHPRAIVIEYNALYPPTVKWVQKYDVYRVWDGTSHFGASLKSLELLGLEKGYRLVACDFVGVNAFFVRQDLAGEEFCEPFTAECHYEPARYYLAGTVGHKRNFGDFLRV